MLVASYQKLLLNGEGMLDGTPEKPSVSRIADPDTGIYFPAQGTMAVSTNGVERIRFGEFIEIKTDGRTVLPNTLQPAPSGSQTINCATTSTILKIGGNATITLQNMGEGQAVTVVVSSTGSAYTITWAGETIYWAGATIPTPTATGARFDFYTLQKLGGIVFGAASLNHG